MIDNLAGISISEALALFRSRKLSPVELMQALIERAAKVEPVVNALSEQHNEQALRAAREAEKAYAKGGGEPRALEGIPYSVKSSLAVKGYKHTSGSLIHKDRVATESEPTLDRLREAGGIFHAQTTAPEFTWAWVTYSRLYGVTRNPWNSQITSGGSCGGSAAAVASGTTLVSIGADSAGSIRMPSAMCGVVGYKPPSGRNPEGTTYCDDLYNDYGPITRTVEDAAIVQNVISGPHPDDNNTLETKLVLDWPPRDMRGIRVAFSHDLGFMEVAPDVRANTEVVLDRLRDMGAAVEEVSIDWAEHAMNAADLYGDFMAGDLFRDVMENHADLVTDYTPHFAAICAKATRADFIESFLATSRAWSKFSPIFDQHDTFLCPTVATTEVPATMKPWEEMVINGKSVDRWVFTLLFSMFKTCPVLAVPSGLGENGVPTGVQVVGRKFDDVTAFQVAAAAETKLSVFEHEAR